LTRINLLPPEKIKKKRVGAVRAPSERSYWWLLVVLPLIVIVAMGFWYFSLNSQMKDKEKALADAKTELADWQAKNQVLQQYKSRQEQIASIEQVAVKALQGRVYWARILNDIAIMCPKDVWLTSLNGTSSGGTTGTVTFEASALQCPNRWFPGFFYPYYPDYKPVANWLERMAQISEFQRVWLSSAQPAPQGPTVTIPFNLPDVKSETISNYIITFSSTATLNMQTATVGGTMQTAPTTTTTPPTPSTSGTTGGATK
jgi:Tfp pilus assembly protein PilN